MQITYYTPSDLPDDILQYWMHSAKSEDEIGCFLRGSAWYGYMAERNENAVVCVIEDDNEYRGILPLLSGSWGSSCRTYRCKIPVLRVCGGSFLGELNEMQIRKVVNDLLRKFSQAEAILFDVMSPEKTTFLMRSFQSDQGECGVFVHTLFSEIPHYRMLLPADVEQCKSLRSGKTMSRLKEKERALERDVEGKLDLRVLRTRAQLNEYKHRIDELMNRAWQADALGHSFQSDDYIDLAERGWMRCYLLVGRGELIAVDLCYKGDHTLFYECVGYDQRYYKYSPGSLLLHRLLPLLYEENPPVKYLDFGEGEAEYKRRLANDVSHVSACLLVRNTPSLRHHFKLMEIVGRVENGVRRLMNNSVFLRKILRRMKGQGK